MSNASKPAWPDPASFPFNLFGGAPAAVPATGGPLAQGLTSGVDLMKKMLGQMPGGSAIPGFLLPTVDVEELDKRIADLRAAESWLDVNLTMLRATIQGLEVQRNTIAAIKTFGALGSQSAAASMTSTAPAPAAQSSAANAGLPPGWPMSTSPAPAPVEAPEPAPTVAAEPVEPPTPKPRAVRPEKPATNDVDADADATATATPTDALASMAANNWLGYMQDQFSKVAKAALAAPKAASSSPASAPSPAPVRKAAKKKAGKSGRGGRNPRV